MKDVKGYEGLYAVTSCGKVWSYRNNRFLNLYKNSYGYIVVSLCKNGEETKQLVHRLVALAFVCNPYNLPCINHKDENKLNNSVNNLEWCTIEYNNRYGNRSNKASKTKQKACICIELNKTFDSPLSASKEFGVAYASIAKSCRDASKTAGGYHWKYI